MGKTELDVIEYIGQDEEPYDRPIQRYDHARRREILGGLLAGARCGRVLDLGCSNGSWYSFFSDIGFEEIHGVELSEHRACLAEAKGYLVFVGRGQETPYPDDHFDVVVNQDVLVHVLQEEDRRAMVLEALRVLKPGGAYVLTVPSAQAERRRRIINAITGYDLASWLKHKMLGRQGRTDRLPIEENNRYWHIPDLIAFLNEAGASIEEMVGHTFYLGDLTSNFPSLQRRIDSLCGTAWPSAASIVFVKCTK